MEVQDVRDSYGRRSVLRGIDFMLQTGMLVGIVGENGSGKSTLVGPARTRRERG